MDKVYRVARSYEGGQPEFLQFSDGRPYWIKARQLAKSEVWDNPDDAQTTADDFRDFYGAKGYDWNVDVVEEIELYGGQIGHQIIFR